MMMERIRELYDAKPFKPFIIQTKEGRDVLVKHQEFMSFSPSGRHVVVHTMDNRMHFLDQKRIASVRVKRAPVKRKKPATRKKPGKRHG
jgi:hypothetical protein